jgi:hypothetical protein
MEGWRKMIPSCSCSKNLAGMVTEFRLPIHRAKPALQKSAMQT